MMIEPPIDKLVEKVGCKYALVSLLTKRARYLIDKQADRIEESGVRPVSLAARDVYDGVIESQFEDL